MELYERRLRMLRYHIQGVRPSVWVSDLAREYGVHERTVWKDWSKRDRWMPLIARMADEEGDVVAADLLTSLGEARTLLFRAYHNADNSNAQVGALKEIVDAIKEEFRIRQSLGQIRNVQPPVLELSITQERREMELRWQSMSPEEKDELEEEIRRIHRKLTGTRDGR